MATMSIIIFISRKCLDLTIQTSLNYKEKQLNIQAVFGALFMVIKAMLNMGVGGVLDYSLILKGRHII